MDLGPVPALTGPIVRGDAATVRAHLTALGNGHTQVTGLYRAVGLSTLELARQRGLPESRARAIEELLRKGEQDA